MNSECQEQALQCPVSVVWRNHGKNERDHCELGNFQEDQEADKNTEAQKELS